MPRRMEKRSLKMAPKSCFRRSYDEFQLRRQQIPCTRCRDRECSPISRSVHGRKLDACHSIAWNIFLHFVTKCMCVSSARQNGNGWYYNDQTCHRDSPSWVLVIPFIGRQLEHFLVPCCPVHLFYSRVLCAFYFEQIKWWWWWNNSQMVQ